MSRAIELLKAQLEGGLTLTEAADRIGYSRTTSSLYAAGKYHGRLDGVEAALIRAFDVHHCPHTNEPVSDDVCQRKALAPKPFGGSERLAWWVIKYGLIRDLPFFAWLEGNMERLRAREPGALTHAIERSCANKAELVAADETESGVRALLNLGHTFGHAIEAGLGYGEWLHGEAVAAGTVMAMELSRRMGWLGEADLARTVSLFERAGLPTQGPALGADRYLELMALDKKVTAGKLRLVLLEAIGRGVIRSDVPEAELRAAIGACCRG